MNPTHQYERIMTPARERMLKRDAKKLEAMRVLYARTPKIPVPVWEEQKWVTHEQPLSRQTFRHLARLNERAAESAQRKQSRPNPIGNRKKRRKMEATTNINLSNLTDVVEDEPVDSSVEVV